MNRAHLIVETPRWGGEGHRFLVPPGNWDVEQVQKALKAAAEKPVGESWVAVSYPVPQVLKDGTTRVAQETIALVGVAGTSLRPDQLTKLCDQLFGMCEGIKSIAEDSKRVAQAAKSKSKSTLAPCDELDAWLQRLSLEGLPRATPPVSVSPARQGRGRILKRATLGGLPLVVLLVIMSAVQRQSGEPPDGQETRGNDGERQARDNEKSLIKRAGERVGEFWDKFNSPGVPQPQTETADPGKRAREILNQKSADWHCASSELALAILRATDRAKSADEAGDDPIARVAEASSSDEEFLQKLNALDPGNPETLTAFLRLDSDADREAAKLLCDLLPNEPKPEDVLKMRRSIHDAFESFMKLQSKRAATLDAFKDEYSPPSPKSNFWKVIKFSAHMEPDPQLRAEYPVPEVPIFERQDLLILKHFERWLQDGGAQGLAAAFDQVDPEGRPGDGLGDRLKWMKKNTAKIVEAVKSEKEEVQKLVEAANGKAESAKQNIVSLDPFLNAYRWVEGIFTGLGGRTQPKN